MCVNLFVCDSNELPPKKNQNLRKAENLLNFFIVEDVRSLLYQTWL